MSKKTQTYKKYPRKVHEGGRRRKTTERRRKVRVSEYSDYYAPMPTDMKRKYGPLNTSKRRYRK